MSRIVLAADVAGKFTVLEVTESRTVHAVTKRTTTTDRRFTPSVNQFAATAAWRGDSPAMSRGR